MVTQTHFIIHPKSNILFFTSYLKTIHFFIHFSPSPFLLHIHTHTLSLSSSDATTPITHHSPSPQPTTTQSPPPPLQAFIKPKQLAHLSYHYQSPATRNPQPTIIVATNHHPSHHNQTSLILTHAPTPILTPAKEREKEKNKKRPPQPF